MEVFILFYRLINCLDCLYFKQGKAQGGVPNSSSLIPDTQVFQLFCVVMSRSVQSVIACNCVWNVVENRLFMCKILLLLLLLQQSFVASSHLLFGWTWPWIQNFLDLCLCVCPCILGLSPSWSNRFTESCKSAYFALGYAQHFQTPPPISLPVFSANVSNAVKKRERDTCSALCVRARISSTRLTSDVLNTYPSFGRLPLVLLTGSVIVGAVLGTGGWWILMGCQASSTPMSQHCPTPCCPPPHHRLSGVAVE